MLTVERLYPVGRRRLACQPRRGCDVPCYPKRNLAHSRQTPDPIALGRDRIALPRLIVVADATDPP